MITKTTLVKRIRKLWDSGQVLAAAVEPNELFPVRVSLGCPTGAKLGEEFSATVPWAREMRAIADRSGADIDYTHINHRTLGQQKLPKTLVFDSPAQIAGLLEVTDALDQWRRLIDRLLRDWPALKPLAQQEPFRLLAAEKALPRLLEIAAWLKRFPRPGIFLRQLDVPGVDTKLIEKHTVLLDRMLTLLLPAHAYDPSITIGSKHGFQRRYGFNVPEPLIRFRLLNPHPDQWPTDLAVTLSEFAQAPRKITQSIETVLITENTTNGLTMPEVDQAMVIYGLGYGVMSLSRCHWLAGLRLIYWGDLDTHGFAMLSRLRGVFPDTESLMMDRTTLMTHRDSWATEKPGRRHLEPLANLTDEESHVYEGLRHDQWGERIRLEQELIRFGAVTRALSGAGLRLVD